MYHTSSFLTASSAVVFPQAVGGCRTFRTFLRRQGWNWFGTIESQPILGTWFDWLNDVWKVCRLNATAERCIYPTKTHDILCWLQNTNHQLIPVENDGKHPMILFWFQHVSTNILVQDLPSTVSRFSLVPNLYKS